MEASAGVGWSRCRRLSGAGLIKAGLAAAGTVPAHDRTIGQPATTAADERTLREGGRDAMPSELVAMEMPRGPEIAVDGLFGPKTATQAVPQ